MSDIQLEPLAQANLATLAGLMDQEVRQWRLELDWDYAPIRQILAPFIERRILPGYIACCDRKALGYTYFLIQRNRGVIGAVYASGPDPQLVAEALLSSAIKSMQASQGVRRIEAQIIPLNKVEPERIFKTHDFQCYEREYLELALDGLSSDTGSGIQDTARSWDSGRLREAAAVAYRSYRNEVDADISQDYATEEGCLSYLRSLVEHPGCGTFLPAASLLHLDGRGEVCGFVISSQISPTAAMIAQISILPSHQGLGAGGRLIRQALLRMKQLGFRTARLTVSRSNRRACDWYVRLGFVPRRRFGAYVWLRGQRSHQYDRIE